MSAESKAQRVGRAFSDYNELCDQQTKANSLLNEIGEKKKEIDADRSKYNYNNTNVVERYFDDFVKQETSKQNEVALQQADYQVYIMNLKSEVLHLNYKRFSSWFFNEENADKIIRKGEIHFYNSKDFDICTGPLVFDFSGGGAFLVFVMLLVLFGPAYLFYKITNFLSDITDTGPIGTILFNVAGFCAGLGLWCYLLGMFFDLSPVIPKVFMTVVSLVVGFLLYARIMAGTCLKKDSDKFFAVYYPEEYHRAVYDQIMSDFERNKVQKWNAERANISTSGNGELLNEIRFYLKGKYDEDTRRLDELTQEEYYTKNEISTLESQKQPKLSEVDDFIADAEKVVSDKNYNNGVLTDYIIARDLSGSTYVFKHDCRPCSVVYDKNKYRNKDDLNKILSYYVAQLYYGFIRDNYHGIIDFRFVDLKTGGAILSSNDDARMMLNNGLIKCHSNSASVDSLHSELMRQKEKIVGVGETGNIATYNPTRIQAGDNPLKYFIVVYYGKELFKIPNDMQQLYRMGHMFGFIPFFIMSDEEYKDAEENVNSENRFLGSITDGYLEID